MSSSCSVVRTYLLVSLLFTLFVLFQFQEFDKSESCRTVSGDSGSKQVVPPHPVVIYSHGMYSWRQISSNTFEMLASHGYVVFACDHSPSAMVTRHYSAVERGVMEGYDYALPDHIQPATIEERKHYSEGLDTRVHEITSLIDFIQAEDIIHKFNVKVDRVHLMGHSFGAGTMTAVACRDRQRVASCMLCKSSLVAVMFVCSSVCMFIVYVCMYVSTQPLMFNCWAPPCYVMLCCVVDGSGRLDVSLA